MHICFDRDGEEISPWALRRKNFQRLYFQHKWLYYSSSTNSWSLDRYNDEHVPTSLCDGIDIRDEQAIATSQKVDEFSFSDPENETGYYIFISNHAITDLATVFYPK